MRHKFNHILFAAVLFVWLFVSSCQQANSNSTGSEFMPDMAHSIAYEANTYAYYYNNTWGTKDEYYKFAQPGLPVNGTVPRGSAGLNGGSADMDRMLSFEGELTNSGISIPVNGSVPYAYPDTDEGRAQAAADIIQNPIPIQDAKMKEAKELYNVYCGICHGEKGDGAGYLVRDDGGKYPAQPANLLLDQYIDLSNGQYYHAIIHGKNMMGGYADKLSYEERWNVIHYIRSLQAKEKKLAYNEQENTLNNGATPAKDAGMTLSDSFDKQMAANKEDRMSSYMDSDHGHGDDHGDHGHGDDHGDHGHGDDHGDHGHDDDHGNHGHDDDHGDHDH